MFLMAGSAIAALQPPRLLLGTIGVALIAIIGATLDAVVAPTSLGGIQQPLTSEVASARNETLETIRRAIPETIRPPRADDGALALEDVREAARLHYLESMKGLEDEDARTALAESFQTQLATLDALAVQGPFEATMLSAGEALSVFVRSVIHLEPAQALQSLAQIAFEIPSHLWQTAPIMSILIGLLLAFSFALFGGGIARLDALDTGTQRKETAWTGLEFAWANINLGLQSMLIPLGIVAILTALLAILGIPFNFPVLDIVGGLLYVIAIFFGLICAILLIGFAIMFPMLLGAVAVERADAGDSIQRAWGALLTKPAHLALLLAIALISFAVSLAIVDFVVVLALDIAAASWGGIIRGDAVAQAGSITLLDFNFTTQPGVTSDTAVIASAFMGFWETLLTAIILGYIFSWLASFGSRIFLAMRLLIDRQSPAVIWVPGALGGTTLRHGDQPAPKFQANDSFGEGDR